MDINGPEMHKLYKFAKRSTPSLFVPRYGMASHLYEHNSKFLFDRYGEMRHYYTPSVELAIIEADIAELLRGPYEEKKYKQLLEPLDMFI